VPNRENQTSACDHSPLIVKAGDFAEGIVSAAVGIAGEVIRRLEFAEDRDVNRRAKGKFQFIQGGDCLAAAVLLALVEGLQTTLAATGDPLQVVVMRKGSEFGNRQQLYADAVSRSAFHARYCHWTKRPSAGIVGVISINLSASNRGEGTNIVVRGQNHERPIRFQQGQAGKSASAGTGIRR
jgi:hypothetical protein